MLFYTDAMSVARTNLDHEWRLTHPEVDRSYSEPTAQDLTTHSNYSEWVGRPNVCIHEYSDSIRIPLHTLHRNRASVHSVGRIV